MKPSWENAPEWANWLAMDYDGTWWWYSNLPKFDNGEWLPGSGTKCEIAVLETDPETTLEPRPASLDE